MQFVREKMKKLPPSHGLDHVERVLKLSGKIAKAENADILPSGMPDIKDSFPRPRTMCIQWR
jgi:hypothetical protein